MIKRLFKNLKSSKETSTNAYIAYLRQLTKEANRSKYEEALAWYISIESIYLDKTLSNVREKAEQGYSQCDFLYNHYLSYHNYSFRLHMVQKLESYGLRVTFDHNDYFIYTISWE